MDIIAAHQAGLIERLEEEVAALAGRPRDHGQRAVVLHHLYDHSRAAHEWALAEARRALRVARGITALEQHLARWAWMMGGSNQAKEAMAALANALGKDAQARCATAYLAYRTSATPALRNEAEARFPSPLLAALDECHKARRLGEPITDDVRHELSDQSELAAIAVADAEALNAAWATINATGLKRKARRLLGDKALARSEARDRKRGWSRVERELRADPMLPASFRANPAQHFYSLQHELGERRRQQWREACDREPDAFELAA